jgi:hypothetical protein
MKEPGPTLAVPEGWVVDHATRRRLQHRLAHAESTWAGVVAERGDLPAGASYRVHAERRALASESKVRAVSGPWVQGAALVRPGVGWEVADDGVWVEGGELLGDDGAVVHDPWRPLGSLEDASPLGRPLVPRPIALFLGLEDDPYLADWVRGLVNNLLARDVEGRIAVPSPTAGRHLTRPCTPTEQSVAALAPEVIVALDDGAVEQSAAWLRRRVFGLVRLTPDTNAEVTVESVWVGWRRHLEARIGRGVEPGSMADVVQLLGRARVA